MIFDVIDVISKISDSLSASAGSAPNLNVVMELIATETGATASFVLLMQPETEKLVPAASHGLSVSAFRRLENRADSSILRKVFDESTPLTIADISSEANLDFLRGDNARRLVAAPIRSARKTVGALCAEFPQDETLNSGELVRFLLLVASMLAQTLRVEHAVLGERQKLIDENSHLKQELKEKYDFSNIVGNSHPMKQVYDQVTQVAKSNATVLLRGESGTGKEMIANAIHYNSLRAKRPFVKINCAALPDTLIEAELFGHEK